MDNRYPLHVPIREGNPIHGFVQCEALRAIDLWSREKKGAVERIGSLDDASMEEVMARVAVVVGLDK
jgi:mRNA interferase MazF